jgi:predicted transcriptional regulator
MKDEWIATSPKVMVSFKVPKEIAETLDEIAEWMRHNQPWLGRKITRSAAARYMMSIGISQHVQEHGGGE